MEKEAESRWRPFDRREFLKLTGAVLGGAAVAAVVTYGVDNYNKEQEAARQEADKKAQEIALAPGSGETEKSVTIKWLPDTVTRWTPKLERYGGEHGIDPNFLAIIMTNESGGDPNPPYNPLAKGLMQITDSTGQDIANRILPGKYQNYDLLDPDTNIEFGAAYIRYLKDQLEDPSQLQGISWLRPRRR